MTKLNDLQRVLLATAAQRDDASLLPYEGSLDTRRVRAAIPGLLKRGLAAERAVDGPAPAWREDGGVRYGLFATDAGKAAVGAADDDVDGVNAPAAGAAGGARADTPTPSPTNKTAAVIAMLSRAEGATLDQIVAATGWLPHSTRAVLTGLRKKGHNVSSTKADGVRVYRIADAAR